MDLSRNGNRGFAFVRFPTEKEARKAVDLVIGRSWGNRKLQAQLVEFPAKKKRAATGLEEDFGVDASSWKGFKPQSRSVREDQGRNREAASLLKLEGRNGVRLADWVAEEKKKELQRSCVGFLKVKTFNTTEVEYWLYSTWGKMIVELKSLDETTMWILLSSDLEVDEVLRCVESDSSSPFLRMERWMEVLSKPVRLRWFRFFGVPLHGWCEESFLLLGRYFGSKVMVDPKTVSREELRYGRVRVGIGDEIHAPSSLDLWIKDLLFSIKIEEEVLVEEMVAGEEMGNDEKDRSKDASSLVCIDLTNFKTVEKGEG